jgi:DNA replication and repair protein RecF
MAELHELSLRDFRNYRELDLSLPGGRILITGANGQGKSNLLEAIGYLGTLSSFRGASTDTLISQSSETSVLRGTARANDRDLLIEIELSRNRPNRVQLNKQRLTSSGALVGVVPVTVFGPDDLDLVKAGPSVRRRYLDSLLVQLGAGYESVRSDLERILRQRNALLRQAKGRLTPEVEATLDVWDAKLSATGERWARARGDLVERLQPEADAAYAELAGPGHPIAMTYAPEWLDVGLAQALRSARGDEIRRGITLVGPHRDELELGLSKMPARTHASQGEQRTLALAMRIAGHHVVAMTTGTSPLLLLDDVFSELDPSRATALLDLLVAEQTFVTTASQAPPVDGYVHKLIVEAGTIRPA